jgi:membrane protein DedA with SNARE-associated domain
LSNKSFLQSKWFVIGIRVLAFIFVIAITVYIFSIRDKAQQFAPYGYPGIFLLAFLAYATVFLPAPGVAVVFTMGAVFNPLFVALVAGVKIYQRSVEWLKKYGSIAMLVFSAIPNPFFDVTGAAAGALKMPVTKFLFWTWIGETIKMIIFAYAGASWLKTIFG